MASVFAFASRYLDENKLNALLEVLKMTDLATMLIEDAVSEREIAIAKRLLKRGISIMAVAEDTGLDKSTLEQLQEELNNE